ncbi:hypothetical protein [Streptomyces pristinaespiralis]|uniref:hypothetical protein n=1 Tax=Streptomyces pristinaespiralis TaxID=38300 RepID=UPI003838ABDB
MVKSTAVQDLESALDAVDDSTVLTAAWDAFDLTVGVADAITWQGGDELQALAAAAAGAAGRALLPLPATGSPREVPTLPAEAEALEPFVVLMSRTHAALITMADSAEGDTAAQDSLREAADHALVAANALALVWGR